MSQEYFICLLKDASVMILFLFRLRIVLFHSFVSSCAPIPDLVPHVPVLAPEVLRPPTGDFGMAWIESTFTNSNKTYHAV